MSINKVAVGAIALLALIGGTLFWLARPIESSVIFPLREQSENARATARKDNSPKIATSSTGAAPAVPAPPDVSRVLKAGGESAAAIGALIRSTKDLEALFKSLERDHSPAALAMRAIVSQRCTEAGAPAQRSAALSHQVAKVPPDVPFADRRELGRQHFVEFDWTKRCGNLAKQPASSDELRAMFAKARDAGSPHGELAFLIEAIRKNAKSETVAMPAPADGMKSYDITTGPDASTSRQLFALMSKGDDLVQDKAFDTLTTRYSDKSFAMDGTAQHPQEVEWAWKLAKCDVGGNCGADNPSLLRTCYMVPDICRFNSVEAWVRGEYDERGALRLGPASAADWSRVQQLRDALTASMRSGDYSRFGLVDEPLPRARPGRIWATPPSPFKYIH